MASNTEFSRIVDARECKFDYLEKKEYLRKISYKRISFLKTEKIREEIYRRVSTDAERDVIKNAGGKWTLCDKGRIGNVTVYEHVDNEDYITGWCKTVEKEKKNEKTINRVRYYRRVGAK